ncbi:MAG TPA: formyltransferase family protein, partial [Chitinophagaceae bacterium]
EKETGVTTFKLQQEIDTGNILMQQEISINENETAGELHDELKNLGASVLVKTIAAIAEESIKEIPQPTPAFDGTGTHNSLPHLAGQPLTMKSAPKINAETCKIDWSKSTNDIFNLIRGLSPYPTAFTYLEDKIFKIFSAKKDIVTHQHAIGSIHTDEKMFLKFACADGFIYCTDIQLQGKKRMSVEDFLRGYKFNK